MSQNSGDLRVRRTKILLREALVALIEERSFDAITVGEIAKRAMVSRAAFYRYYQDKYDLVEKIFEEAMDTLQREMDLRGNTVVGEYTSEPWMALLDREVQMERTPDPLVRLFDHFATYKRLYRALLGPKGSSWFQTKIRAKSLSKQHVRQREPHDGFRSRVSAVGRDAHRCDHLVA